MSEDIYLPLPADPAQRITELHVWVATHADGSEGIITVDMEMPPVGLRHMPLMSSKLAVAEQLRGRAERAAVVARRQGIEVTAVRLLSFDLRVK